jgi:hypothetical protein
MSELLERAAREDKQRARDLDLTDANSADPSEPNLWASQWRDERIRKARADYRERDAAWLCLKNKSTDYAKSLKMARDVCKQVLALWESSPVGLPSDGLGTQGDPV